MKTTKQYLKCFFWALTIVLFTSCSSNEEQDSVDIKSQFEFFDSNYELDFQDPLKEKNFFLLSVIQREVALAKVIMENDEIIASQANKFRDLESIVADCNQDINCIVNAFKYSAGERQEISGSLSIMTSEGMFDGVIEEDLKPSGFYQRYKILESHELISQAWQDAAKGINHILDTYGLGKKPTYPKIDSISYDVNSSEFESLILNEVNTVLNDTSDKGLFFEPSLNLAMALLKMNNRDEAARYEPLHTNENKAAIENIDSIAWEEFEYSAILILGDGPENANVPIESLGLFRVRLAAQRYEDGLAPLIILSGGHVKPFQTPFNEALEMKKVLMTTHSIPENAIIVEPFARHTTTNLRNASRLIYQYGIPHDKKALITTSKSQSSYVESGEFQTRSQNELKYIPIEVLNRISDNDLAFKPVITSLHVDSTDPLDP